LIPGDLNVWPETWTSDLEPGLGLEPKEVPTVGVGKEMCRIIEPDRCQRLFLKRL